jgi:hypothetical protein
MYVGKENTDHLISADEDDGKKRKVGNWKIIDIDDLLDGNVFH